MAGLQWTPMSADNRNRPELQVPALFAVFYSAKMARELNPARSGYCPKLKAVVNALFFRSEHR